MLIQKFRNYIEIERRLSVHTVKSYLDDLDQFRVYALNKFEISDIVSVNYHVIRSWMAVLMENGNSARTVNRKISSLKAFYKFLKREGVIVDNPTLKIVKPKTSKRLPVFIEQQNMINLFESFEFEDSFKGRRDKLVLGVFYNTGIRLSELINIKVTDVDFGMEQIKVLGKRNKERIIPITSELIVQIKEYIVERQSCDVNHLYLFVTDKGVKLYDKFVYRLVNLYLSEVSTVTKKSPHVLRHTFATHMLNNGAELNAIKELLGHANLSATEVYTHNTFEKLKDIYKQAHPRA
jgi:integrase/recombinase XerC